MSAPVTERTRTAAGSTIPAQRGRRGRGGSATAAQKTAQQTRRGTVELGTVTTPKKGAARTSGTQKAYARREERLRRLAGGPQARAATSGRAQFALLLMVLLGVGLVATLWLSTAAAADSYRLQDARTAARQLSSQSERLHREVASMESAPELARRAAGIGMVPVQDPARLVVRPDGTVTVVGVPMPAVAKAPPVPPAAARPEPPLPADAASQAPADQVDPGAAGTDAAAGAESGPDPAGGPPRIGAPATSAASTGVGQEGAGEDGNGAGNGASAGGTADRSTAGRSTAGRSAAASGPASDDSTASDSTASDSTARDSGTSTGARRATGSTATGSDTGSDTAGGTANAAGDGGTAAGGGTASRAATGANAGRTAPSAG